MKILGLRTIVAAPVLALSFSLFSPSPSHAGGVIFPVDYEAEIELGETVEVDAAVLLDPGGPAVSLVDVFFVTDGTGSMGGTIADVQNSAANILNTIAGAGADPRFDGIDVAFGVGLYLGDPSEPAETLASAYQLQEAVTTDLVAVEAAIDDWSATGGGDTPEANFFALHQIACEGCDTDGLGIADTGVGTGQVTGWREGAGRVIVWFGDAKSHTVTVSLPEAQQELQAQGVVVCAINTENSGSGIDDANQATGIVNVTGGVLINNVGGAGAVVDAILNAVAEVTETVDLSFATIPGPIEGLDVTLNCTDPAGCDEVSPGDARDFEWIIQGMSSGHYEFQIVALGIAGATADITIDVASSCGNGTVDSGEGCDDGANGGGDGCSDDCLVEECWTCPGNLCQHDDGALCDDGEECTLNDQCSGGTCGGTDVPDGTACDSGSGCSQYDWCVSGECTGTFGSVVAEKRAKVGVESLSEVSVSVLDDKGNFSLGRKGVMADGTLASAAVARLGIKSEVDDLAANAVRFGRLSVVNGTQTGWVDQGVPISDVCVEPVFSCDEGNDISVEQYGIMALSPGAYGDLFVGPQAVLTLEAGEYDFCSIKGGAASEVYVVGAGPTVIRVRDRMITGRNSFLGPQGGAKAPLVQSGGVTRLGVDSQTAAFIEGPENTVKLSRGAELDGTVCARKFATAKAGYLVCDLPAPSPAGAFVDGPIFY